MEIPSPSTVHISVAVLTRFNVSFPVMVATKEEMYSARISPEFRDYCAHKLIAFKDCRYRKFPFVVLCSHEFHEYQQCEYEE